MKLLYEKVTESNQKIKSGSYTESFTNVCQHP